MANEPKNDPQDAQGDPQDQQGAQGTNGAQGGEPSAEQKAKRLEKEVADLKAQLEEANKQVGEFSKKLEDALTQEDVEKAVKEAKDAFEKEQAEASAKATAREKKLVVENELIKANCIDTTSALAHIDLDKVEIASDGHISGLDVSGLAESHAHLFEKANTSKVSSAGTPGGNGKKMTKEEIMAIKDNSERRAAIAENAELFD